MSLKLKILILVLLCTLPIVLLVIIITYNQFRAAQTAKLAELETITKLIAAEHKQITEGARQLLITLSATPAITTPTSPNCSAFLTSLRTEYIRYTNFGLADSTGHVFCAADHELAFLNPPSTTLINQTLADQNFTLGSYYQIKEGGAVINFAYPLSTTRIVYASLSLDWVSDFTSSLPIPPELVINILDQDGSVLARRPKINTALGQNFATDSFIQQILRDNQGTAVRTGIDGVTRLYAFASLGEDQQTFIAAGLPQSVIYADIRSALITSILTLLIVTAISSAFALKIGEILIVKQIESLQRIDKLKDEFVSLASHQLRSPLTAIRWLSESLLDSRSGLTRPQRSVLTKIHTTALRLIHLTSALLNISRLESGTLTPHPQLIDLTHNLAQVTAEFKPTARRGHLRLLTQFPPHLKVRTDPSLVCEISRILLGNALKYSPPRGAVKLTLQKFTDRLVLKVTDHGIGVPASALPHLFTRFYRADNAKLHSPSGNGLGLYLAHLIAQKLGATLTCSSRPGIITTFSLTLPNKVS